MEHDIFTQQFLPPLKIFMNVGTCPNILDPVSNEMKKVSHHDQDISFNDIFYTQTQNMLQLLTLGSKTWQTSTPIFYSFGPKSNVECVNYS